MTQGCLWVSLASIIQRQTLTGLEQGSSDSVQPFTRLCIISVTPEGKKTANPADGKDLRTIRLNTCSAHLGRSIMKQPAQQAASGISHKSQKEASANLDYKELHPCEHTQFTNS